MTNDQHLQSHARTRAGAEPVAVDHMTKRGDHDALQGHFVSIDLTNEQARTAVEARIGEGNAGFGSGDYGVYLEPIEVDEDGYPLTTQVLLRDEHACIVSGIPYDALKPAAAGRR